MEKDRSQMNPRTEHHPRDHLPADRREVIKSESDDDYQPTFQSTEVISDVKIVPESIAQNSRRSLVMETSTSSQIFSEDIKSESDDEFQATFQSTEVISDVKIDPEPNAQTEYLTTFYNPSEMSGTSVSNDASSNEDGDDQDGHTIDVYINDEPSSPPKATQPPQIFYSCPKCPTLFDVKAHMMRHQRIHERKPLTCKLCGKIYMREVHLLRHKCALNEKQPFMCPLCGQTFIYKSPLDTHLRTHEKPLVCQDCGKDFLSNSALIIHRRKHTGKKLFKCNDCGKEYVQKSSLAVHQKIHSETKPISCPECGESFLRQIHLNTHRKTHHSKRQYMCPDCGDFFMQSSSLVLHMKIHSSKK